MKARHILVGGVCVVLTATSAGIPATVEACQSWGHGWVGACIERDGSHAHTEPPLYDPPPMRTFAAVAGTAPAPRHDGKYYRL